MKKLYFLFSFFLVTVATSAQCVIDSTNVPNPGVYPDAANLAHIQQGVFYDETVQGRIQTDGDTTSGGLTFHYDVDSLRMDSISGLPAGINWQKNPDILPGGGAGCVRFYGTSNASGGQYDLTAWGTVWIRLTGNTPFGTIDTPYVYHGNLNSYSPFGGYYLTVDGGATLSASTTVTDLNCPGVNTGSATVTPTGGSNYTYLWSNGGTTSTISNLSAGTYTVTVSSGASTATASATVTQPPAFSVTTSTTPSTGSNGSATATPTGGTPGYTYMWNGGQQTAAIGNLAPATYNVTVTDSHGCTVTAEAVVSFSGGTLSVNTGKTDVSCFGGNNGSATATPSGGSNYTYAWNNGGNTATISNLTVGTYTVTVTSGASTATASVNISQPTALTATTSTSPSTGSNGSATVTATGGTPGYSYNWSNNQTTSTINGLAPGTYTVTITDNHGCTTTTSAVVNSGSGNLSVNISKTDITCFGAGNGSATANASGNGPFTYAWSNNGNTAFISNLPAGTYTVTVTSGASSATASVNISQPTALTATTSTSPSTGSNGSATVTATGGTPNYSYNWSNNQTTPTINGLAPGNYTVTITDNHGCTATAEAVVNSGNGNLSVNVSKTDITCFGAGNGSATANATGNGPFTYAWNNNGNTATINNLNPGNYTVTVSANGSSVTASVTITQPAVLSVTATSTPSGGNDGTATASANGGTSPYTYSWSNGQTTSDITGLAAGSYTIIVTDSRACTASATTTVLTGIENIDLASGIKLFPNPANEIIHVEAELNNNSPVTVRVMNLSGQVIYSSQQNTAGKYTTTINCAGFEPGVYVIELGSEKQTAHRRFAIAR